MPTSLFVLAGQSNMGGHFVVDSPPDPVDAGFVLAGGLWTTPVVSPANPALTRFANGPGLAFGRAVMAAGVTPIGILGCNVAGELIEHWTPGHATYETCLDMIDATGLPVAGVLFAQGEADANVLPRSDGERHPTDWLVWFERFCASFRADLGDQRVPALLSRLAHTTASTYDNWATVRAQQDRVRLTRSALIESEPATLAAGDQLHYDDATYAAIGTRLATAWLALPR